MTFGRLKAKYESKEMTTFLGQLGGQDQTWPTFFHDRALRNQAPKTIRQEKYVFFQSIVSRERFANRSVRTSVSALSCDLCSRELFLMFSVIRNAIKRCTTVQKPSLGLCGGHGIAELATQNTFQDPAKPCDRTS